jgi:RimJ/RimL family protein N-acetyltransferase
MTVSIRPAQKEDVGFLVALAGHPEVAPFLAAVRPSDELAITGEIERMRSEPDGFGIAVIERDGVAVGSVTWERVNRRSRIASVGGLALDPSARGSGTAALALELLVDELLDDRGFHRVQLEVYAFNDRALRFFESAGFVREGVRRKAYWRDDRWVDGVLFGLLAEDRS